MIGQRVSLEWNMGDAADDAFATPTWAALDWDAGEWHTPTWLNAPEADAWDALPPLAQAKAELWGVARTVAIFCLALLLVTSTTSTPDLDLRVIARAGIEAALEAEKTAWQADDKALYDTLVDEGIELRWINEWRDLWRLDLNHRQDFGASVSGIERLGNLVEARVTINRPSVDWWRASPYAERRFYRQTPNGWVRTLPDESFWGAEQTLETAHIIFTYTARDTANVVPIAPEIERLYVESRRVFQLSPPSVDQKLHITVTPEMIRRWYYNRNQVLITSPVVSKTPVELSEAEYLKQTLVDLLVYRAIENASVNNQANFYRWGMMIWGLSGWLRNDLLGERSPWDGQANDNFHQLVTLPLQLDAVTDWQGDAPPTRERLMAQYVAADSIVDYIVVVYGREQKCRCF
ncbi:MAG: hypothetical protein R2911_40260 [Caldilineaceae bacterium]